MSQHLQAIVTVLSLVNPAICAAMFSGIESGRGTAAKLTDGLKAAVAMLVILALAALFGAKVLEAFGISLDAFKDAGGGVLAWMGFTMLSGGSMLGGGSDSGNSQTNTDPAIPSLTPLILFAASPGTITGVITVSVAHSRTDVPVTALIAIAVTVTVTFLAMIALSLIGGKNQHGLFHDTVTRFMGLIVIAMGIQFVLNGIKAFMS